MLALYAISIPYRRYTRSTLYNDEQNISNIFILAEIAEYFIQIVRQIPAINTCRVNQKQTWTLLETHMNC